MSFFDAINIAASGLTAERTQMDVTSENLANAQTTSGANGQPYQPQAVELQTVGGNSFNSALASALGGSSGATPGGVQVTGIVSENVPPQLVYDPGNPQANKAGYVKMPNLQPVTEMTNLISESNSYQADITAMQTAKSMYSETLNLLK
jgi:flagellar basal-body rod protein FlgC